MNEKIETDRKFALEVLQPSERDLEHGLALHEDALVMEPYCLGLRAPFDPEPVNELIERNAAEVEIVDLFSELSTLNWARTEANRKMYREAWEASGVDVVFQNAGEEGNDPSRLLKRFSNYSYLTEAMPDFLRKVVTPDDIPAAKASGLRSIAIACNGVPVPAHSYTVGEGLQMIPVFAKLGMRMVHLTYNRRNLIGDGCGETSDGGLSDFGRHVVAELNRCGVIVDVAHTGWNTCLGAIEASDVPIVASHSAACGVHETIRGKPDEVIRALADKGGVIGITNIPGFVGRSRDVAALLDHIDYVVDRFGADHVAIGTDSAFSPPEIDAIEEKLTPRPTRPTRWESLWPQGSFGRGNERETRSMAWTNWPLFTVGLVQRGHDDETIRKIVGGNLLRVFREVWDRSELRVVS